ncbi:MAG: neutral/alkaline non-lysosomal ceramidase N-terminal domain-containing protein [Planctomycetia bacterium]|nr:neutral/alkaline non-lysosomal ceramidase N-terminal domain-containing protein [Planctomycetia bacterium]
MFESRIAQLAVVALLFLGRTAFAQDYVLSPIGVAKIDITPTEPIRLSGYGFRREPHEGVIHPIWAKALAIGSDDIGPAVLLMVDGTCIPESVTNEVARRLAERTKVVPDKFALSYTHTHTAPMVRGGLDTLFGEAVPADHQAAIDRYTATLIDKLEHVSLAALEDRQPCHLSWAVGNVDFAANRRTPGGPVDHSLPVMFVHNANGELRAIVANYACHCTTLDNNLISGDWAGYAQIHIERAHPGAISMITIGCGADSNPDPRRTLELAEQHGRSLAAEVERVRQVEQKPIPGIVTAKRERIQLAFDTLPTREEWEARARQQDAVGYHARVQLARLDAGPLPTELGYTIQTWTFGDDLAMVFLPGEVVVDYELRLKREFDPQRIWVNAYSNDAPCYIPSRRIWEEGGYEGASAMTYYDRPTRLTADTEERIFAAIHRLLPDEFRATPAAIEDAK